MVPAAAQDLGKKNCELGPEDIRRVLDAFEAFEETGESKIFPNEAFGYRKVTVERPLRISGIDPDRAYSTKDLKDLRSANGGDPAGGPDASVEHPAAIRKIHKRGSEEPRPAEGLFQREIDGEPRIIEFHPDPDRRDTEQVRLLEEGGIEGFIAREVTPYAPDAWFVPGSVKTGYEINFTRHFYKPPELRSLEEIRADILAVERETEGLLEEIVGEGA